MDEESAASRVLTQDEAFLLIKALEQAVWYQTKSGEMRLPKGVEVAPV